jgi:hypothetical protein
VRASNPFKLILGGSSFFGGGAPAFNAVVAQHRRSPPIRSQSLPLGAIGLLRIIACF